MKPIGIYGGTFDPIHHGHLIMAMEVKEMRELDKIIFIPAHVSPHKQEKNCSSPDHRLAMLKLAIEDINGLEYSDYELEQGDISYTFDTIRELKNRYIDIELIIGYDNLIKFDTWKNPQGIIDLATLVVLKRVTEQKTKNFHQFYAQAEFVNTPTVEISSTQIREKVKEGLPIDFLVPNKVKEYIYSLGLYK